MTDGFAQADGANRLANLIRLGVLTEIDLTARPAKARAEIEEGWTTDFLPVFQISAGRVRSWSAPMADEQVMVFSPSGEPGGGVILRGLNYDGMAAPSSEELLTILAEWEDGAADRYDEATKTRTIAVPEGGKLELIAGALTITVGPAGIVLDAAGQPVSIKGDAITLDGPVNLGGTGGAAVARVGDPIVNNKISTGSARVKAV